MLKSATLHFTGLFLVVLLISNVAPACPQNLAYPRLRNTSEVDLCFLYDRYHEALQTIHDKGIHDPEKLANLTAPRFINLPNWIKKGPSKNYNPWLVYDPAPQTWKSWAAGSAFLESQTRANAYTENVRPLTLEWIKDLHKISLGGGLDERAGTIRKTGEVGKAISKAYALTRQQISGMTAAPSTITWHSTKCLDDQSPEFITQFRATRSFVTTNWPDTDAQIFFIDQGQEKQCGYYDYPGADLVPGQLQAWLNYANQTATELNSRLISVDPIARAAKIQKWFVSIHPFADGNGRISRFMMDYFFKSLGLPAPILKDMDNDLYFSDANWTAEVSFGLDLAVRTAERCAKDLSTPGCNAITENP